MSSASAERFVMVQTNQLPSPGEPVESEESIEPHFFSPKKQKTAAGHVVSKAYDTKPTDSCCPML